nr:hypothetical protein [Tanacetum cinerariifolium]
MPELEDIVYSDDEEDVGVEADLSNLETKIYVCHIPTTRVHKDHPVNQIIGDLNSTPQTRSMTRMAKEQGGLHQINNEDFHTYLPKGKRAIGSKWVFRNKKNERGIMIRNKARLVAQGHTQEEGIDYDEVFALVERIKSIKLFLAYASFMGFMVYQMDVKRAFLYETIKEEVYVCQPLVFEDPDYPNKVYKVVKALYGLHQAPRAWYETLELCKAFERLMKDKFQMSSLGELTFFLGLQAKQKDEGIFISQDNYVAKIVRKFSFTDVKSARTPIETEKHLLKDPDGEDVDVYIYRSMISSLMYLTSSRPDIMFAICACARFQVTPKVSHLHVVKMIFRYFKGKPHLGLWYLKDSFFNLVAYSNSDYAGASLVRKSTIRGCQFLCYRLISWQCKKQTVVATSLTEAQYVAAASCCAQVLWIQNQLMDYGKELASPKQMDLGKDIINPFMAGSFPKTKWHFITAVSYKLMLFYLTKVAAVNLMLLELARMGYEKPPPNLTFYKAFFSAQWKFLIHTLIQCLSAKRTAWNDFSCSMASAVIYIATGRKINFFKYIFDSMITYPIPTLDIHPLLLLRREWNPLLILLWVLKRMHPKGEGEIEASDADEDITLVDVETQEERMHPKGEGEIEASDADEDITLVDGETQEEEVSKSIEETCLHSSSQEKYNNLLKNMARYKMEHFRGMTYDKYDQKQENIDWNVVAEKMQEKHLDNIKKYQNLKRKPISVAQARKNMIVYLRNMVGSKIAHFKGMTYDQVRPIFERKYNKVQTFFKPDRDEEPAMKREKDYPFTDVVLLLMLSVKLQVDEDCEMARDLVMKIFLKANQPKSKSLDTSSN